MGRGDVMDQGFTTMCVEHRFRATHAVASDPLLQQPHEHEWCLSVEISGHEVPPGWIMDFADLRRRLAAIVPNGSDLNALVGQGDTTAERVRDLVVRDLVLPANAQLVEVTLTEAPGNTVRWRR